MTSNDNPMAARSPLHPLHEAEQAGARPWIRHGGYAIPADPVEPARVARCALADLSFLPRLGWRGPAAADYLRGRGYRLPDQPNQALRQTGGGWVARLSRTEFLLLGNLGEAGETLRQEHRTGPPEQWACYLLPRQDSHAWLALTGQYAPEVMAKLCGVDLSPAAFAPGAVAQTSVARTNCMIINAGDADTTCFHLLCDSTLACYLWPVLLDAMREFDGQSTGALALDGLL